MPLSLSTEPSGSPSHFCPKTAKLSTSPSRKCYHETVGLHNKSLVSIIPSASNCSPPLMTKKAIFFSFLQMERMKYPSKYIDKVRSHGLDGPALVFGDVDDLKDLLDMTFGEWATFRLHFLGLKPHHQAQNKKLVKKSAAQTHFPPRFPLHVANQYSSNPCLATCST